MMIQRGWKVQSLLDSGPGQAVAETFDAPNEREILEGDKLHVAKTSIFSEGDKFLPKATGYLVGSGPCATNLRKARAISQLQPYSARTSLPKCMIADVDACIDRSYHRARPISTDLLLRTKVRRPSVRALVGC
jgi:hypothetical protein